MSLVNCLFLLDCKNLICSVRNIYSTDARIDYLKLKQVAMQGCNKENSVCVAYIDLDNPWIQQLSRVLSTLNYKVVTYGPQIRNESLAGVKLAVDCMNMFSKFERISVGSGRGDITPLYEFLSLRGLDVWVLSFEDGLSSQISKYVSCLLELDESVLYEGGSSSTEQSSPVAEAEAPEVEVFDEDSSPKEASQA